MPASDSAEISRREQSAERFARAALTGDWENLTQVVPRDELHYDPRRLAEMTKEELQAFIDEEIAISKRAFVKVFVELTSGTTPSSQEM